jgi:CubicO group peptidase (beta-lactamase class C family)
LVHELLLRTVDDEGLPGIIAAITDETGVVAIASAGTRKEGTDVRLETTDRVHIGSCTKAMTCAMLASLVAEGALAWETELRDALPQLAGRIHADYRSITLWQLLTHRAGVPANAKNWWAYPNEKIRKRRLMLAEANLKSASEHARGNYRYSNLGYMIAGCMAEQATGVSWEALMKARVFDRMGMRSAGFGPPGPRGKTEEPWGHVRREGEWKASQNDNAEALGPAGRVHCSIADWARFLARFARSTASPGLAQLREAEGDYAGGWIMSAREWAKGRTLSHSGSNGRWYSTVWVAPALKRAFIVATNGCDDGSHQICDAVIGKLIEIERNQ